MSPFHAWIRFLEFCLLLGYKIQVKKWQARKKDKDKVQKRKQEIQIKMKRRLGLNVDKVKPGGSSNDGNTGRRFFENHEVSAGVTGVI